MKKFILFSSLIVSIFIKSNEFVPMHHQPHTIYLYPNNSEHHLTIVETFKKFNIKFALTNTIQKDDRNLYVICDVASISQDDLPRYYIAYQTCDFRRHNLTSEYLSKLQNAIAVWDYSWDNIDNYRETIFNYYYLPRNYEYADPVILPCFLPLQVLETYKETLVFSNKVNSEISSHAPLLFFYSYIHNPKLIIEAGVALGNSSHVFSKITSLCNTQLLGIDFDKHSAAPYQNIKNSTFLLMNDVDFATYYRESPYNEIPIDVVFIDTDHEYNHTVAEIATFLPLLAPDGALIFHDSHVTPLKIEGREGWWRLNNTIAKMNPLAPSNPRGVAPAIKKCFSISFDESKYQNMIFHKDGGQWHMIHYPFCNGLTVLQKIQPH